RDLGIAEEALTKIIGDERGRFSAPSASSEDRGGRKFTWITSDDRLKLVAEATVQDGNVADLKIEPEPTPLFQAELDSRQAGILRMLTVVSFLVIWPAIIAAIVAYFIGLARRQINHRQTLLLLLLSFFFFLLIGLLGSYADNFRIGFRI